MNRAEIYAWVIQPPARKPPPPPRPSHRKRRYGGRAFMEAPCPGCGFSPIGWRKTCPACIRPRPQETE